MSSQGSGEEALASADSDQTAAEAAAQAQAVLAAAAAAPAPAPVPAPAPAPAAGNGDGLFESGEEGDEDDWDSDEGAHQGAGSGGGGSSSAGGGGRKSSAAGDDAADAVALRQMPFGVILRFLRGYLRATALQRPSVFLLSETHGQHAVPFKGLVRVVLNICNWPTTSVRAGSMEWFRLCREQLCGLVDKVSVLGTATQVAELQRRVVEIHQGYNQIRIKKDKIRAAEIALIDSEVAKAQKFLECVEQFFKSDSSALDSERRKLYISGATEYLRQVQDRGLKRALYKHYPNEQELQRRLDEAEGELQLSTVFAKLIGRRGGYQTNTHFLRFTLELLMEAILNYLNKLQFVSFYPLPAKAKYARKIKSSKDGARERGAFDSFDRFFHITNRPAQAKVKKWLDAMRELDIKIKAASATDPTVNTAKAAKEALRQQLCNHFVRQMYFLFDYQRIREGKYDTHKKKDQSTKKRKKTDYMVCDPDVVKLSGLRVEDILELETDGRRNNNVGELIRVMGMYLYLFLDSYPDLITAVGGAEAVVGVGASGQVVPNKKFSQDILQPFIHLVVSDWRLNTAARDEITLLTLDVLDEYLAYAPQQCMVERLRIEEQLSSEEEEEERLSRDGHLASAGGGGSGAAPQIRGGF